jgi:DNA-binding transcriptional LysR family regulator
MNLIDSMRAFAAVVDSGSFTRAAEKLESSKTLTSKKVQALENHLGTRLLNRTTRSLSLTEAGRLFYERCQPILEDVQDLESLMQNQLAAPRGRLVATAPTTFGEIYIAPLLPVFVERYPDVEIDLSLTDRHVDIVEEGFDVAVRIADLPSSTLIARKLAGAPIHLCATPEYLDAHGRPDQPFDLTKHSCVIDTNFSNPRAWPFRDGTKKISVPVKGPLSVNSARAVRDNALAGCGIALCPGYMIADEREDGRLETVLADYNAFNISVFAVYSSRRNLAPKVRAFVDFLATELARASKRW